MEENRVWGREPCIAFQKIIFFEAAQEGKGNVFTRVLQI